MRSIAILLLLMTVAFAGCSDAGEETPNETPPGHEYQPTEDTGIIRGVVVDGAIAPIAGVLVRIDALDLETESLEDGSFGFGDLEPGVYFLSAGKAGYAPTQASVTVKAAEEDPPIVRVQLLEDASTAPYYQTTVWDGHLRCGVMAAVITFPCSVIRGTEDELGDYNSEVREFEVLPTFIQSQLHWRNTQPAGESLFFNYAHCCDNAGFAKNGSAEGPSPLVINAHEHEMVAGKILEDGLEIRVFGGSYPGTNTGMCVPETPVRGPLCPWGVGAQVEQPIASYTSEFYNILPPEGWNYIEHGDPLIDTT